MSVPDYKINYKSDFVLTINGDAGWATQFCIKFWTGMPSQAYFVGFDGVKYVNCRVGDTPTQLLVMFDDHHLPIGPLKMQIAYHTTIEEFPGSVFDEVTNARDVIVTIDGTDYQVMLDFTGEDAPELEFDLPAYANEAERIQNELQRQQNEADRIAAELQREQATAAAVQGAENVNAQLAGNILTVTNRQGVSSSVNTKGEQGEQGPAGPEGPQGEQGETGISIVSFTPKSETSTTLIYTVTFSDGHTQDVAIPKGAKGDTGATGPQGPQGDTGVSITAFTYASETETDMIYTVTFSDSTTQQVAIPKGEKGDTGDQGPVGPQGPQGPMGDVAVITPEQQAAFTMYSVPGQNTNGPMTQKAVTDALVAGSISYDNSASGLASTNAQGALDEVDENTRAYMDIDLSLSPFVNYRIATSTKKFTTNTSDKQIFVQIIGGEEYMIAFPNDVPWGNYAWLTDIHVSSGGTPSYCNGETNTITIQAGESRLIKAPSDAQYICITASSNGTSTMPSYFRQILRTEGIERKLESFVSRNTPYYQSLTNYASGTVSTGEFQTSNNSYVVSSYNYGLWYDVTSFVGKKLKFIKKTGQMRVTFSNTILTSAISNLTPYLLSNIYISDTDFEVVIPQNEGGSVYLWVHYIKGGVDRQPLDILLEGNTNSMGEELNYINRTIYGTGTNEYSGEKINLNNIFKYRVNFSLMNLDKGTSSAYLQGADVFGNYFFQFYVGGRCCVYDLTTLTKVKEFTMDNLNKSSSNLAHWGSVHFSNEFANVGDELPLLYTEGTNIAGAGGDVAVVNINAAYAGTGDAEVVRFITLIDYPYPNVCCAFDFNRGIGYMIGRPVAAERFGRYYLQPFSISDGSYDINNLIDVKSSGPLQDATFRNDVVYIVSGWNNLYNEEGYTNYAVPQRITAVNVLKKAITAVLETGLVSSSNAGEPEGIAIYNNSFYVSRRSSSTNNKLMKIEV